MPQLQPKPSDTDEPRASGDGEPVPPGAPRPVPSPARSPIAQLEGVWRGEGSGEFPTMESFRYEEEIRFTNLGVPALVYQQRAWSPDDGELLHLETGLWRSSPAGILAVTIALPRVSEISEGSIADGVIALATTSVNRAAGGATLVAVRRHYELRDEILTYEIAMATEGVPSLTRHLVGTLRRTSPNAAG